MSLCGLCDVLAEDEGCESQIKAIVGHLSLVPFFWLFFTIPSLTLIPEMILVHKHTLSRL